MDRYIEKHLREVPTSHEVSDIQRVFRNKFGLNVDSLKKCLKSKHVLDKRLSDVKS